MHDSKDLIKQAARQIIIDEGIVRFNMRKLSNKSGMALGSIYYYYPAKADIIFEIVDDLWSECFVQLKTEGFNSFIEAIEDIYAHISEYFLQFAHNWTRELSTLTQRDKASGRQFENEYMYKIRAVLSKALRDNYGDITDGAKEILGFEGITDFVFTNFMFYMRRGVSDTSKLVYILNKVIL